MKESDLRVGQFYVCDNGSRVFLLTEVKDNWILGIEVKNNGRIAKDSGYQTYIFLEKFKPITIK